MTAKEEKRLVEDAVEEIMACDWGCGCCASSSKSDVREEVRETIETLVSKLKGFTI